MLKKVYSYLLLAVIFAASLGFSSPDGIETGQQFQKKLSPVYLECKEAIACPRNIFKRNFSIKLKNGSGEARPSDEIVGWIGISNAYQSYLAIEHIEINASHRKKGYAFSAIETFLSIYRGEKRASVSFEKFSLSVALRNKAAIRLYEKVGFEVIPEEQAGNNIPGWQWMTLPR